MPKTVVLLRLYRVLNNFHIMTRNKKNSSLFLGILFFVFTSFTLNQLIADKYDVIGKDSVSKFFPEPGPHTNAIGAIFNAKCVVDGLKVIKDCPLIKYLKK